jgi:hypothetical protein
MITYADIEKANSTIKTTDIKGKDYAEVNQRIKAFRMVYPQGSLPTEIISIDNGIVIMKCTVLDEDGRILATGHAYEKENSTFINKTSYIENCETSAVGRALGLAGFGIDTSIASYEEVENAILQQNAPEQKVDKKTIDLIVEMAAKYAEMKNGNANELLKYYLTKYKANSIEDLTYTNGIAIGKELSKAIERSINHDK